MALREARRSVFLNCGKAVGARGVCADLESLGERILLIFVYGRLC
jgi:hypothetical protein